MSILCKIGLHPRRYFMDGKIRCKVCLKVLKDLNEIEDTKDEMCMYCKQKIKTTLKKHIRDFHYEVLL